MVMVQWSLLSSSSSCGESRPTFSSFLVLCVSYRITNKCIHFYKPIMGLAHSFSFAVHIGIAARIFSLRRVLLNGRGQDTWVGGWVSVCLHTCVFVCELVECIICVNTV